MPHAEPYVLQQMSTNQNRPSTQGAPSSNKRPRNEIDDIEPKRESVAEAQTSTGGVGRSNENGSSGNGEGTGCKQSVCESLQRWKSDF